MTPCPIWCPLVVCTWILGGFCPSLAGIHCIHTKHTLTTVHRQECYFWIDLAALSLQYTCGYVHPPTCLVTPSPTHTYRPCTRTHTHAGEGVNGGKIRRSLLYLTSCSWLVGVYRGCCCCHLHTLMASAVTKVYCCKVDATVQCRF